MSRASYIRRQKSRRIRRESKQAFATIEALNKLLRQGVVKIDVLAKECGFMGCGRERCDDICNPVALEEIAHWYGPDETSPNQKYYENARWEKV